MKREQYNEELTDLYWKAKDGGEFALAYEILKDNGSDIKKEAINANTHKD